MWDQGGPPGGTPDHRTHAGPSAGKPDVARVLELGMSIFVHARFDVHAQRQADFEEIALALREQAKEEPGTRTYRWFSSGDGSYLVIEEYTDANAALAHNEHAAELLARVGECAEMIYAELYGPIGPELGEWARSRPQVITFADFPDDGAERWPPPSSAGDR
jgi:quinol monooxygenase YgiN